jgi:hypothetical protein
VGETLAEDLGLLHTLQEVNGDLLIYANLALTEFDIVNLTEVSGDLRIADNAALTSFSLNNVQAIHGSVAVTGNPALELFSIDGMLTAGGKVEYPFDHTETFYISDNEALTSFSFASLTGIDGLLAIESNNQLTTVSFDSLLSVLDITIRWNNVLASISFDGLTDVEIDVDINYNPAITTLNLDSLASVGTALKVVQMANLGSLSFDGLSSVGQISISRNDALTAFSFASLTEVGWAVGISSNVLLCQSMVEDFVDALEFEHEMPTILTEDNADC